MNAFGGAHSAKETGYSINCKGLKKYRQIHGRIPITSIQA
jgi:hypothetical protein